MSSTMTIPESKLYNYSVRLLNNSVLFNEDGWANLDVEVAVAGDDSLEIYTAAEEQTRVGVRVFVADNNGDILEPKELVSEFRAEGTHQTIKNGEKTIVRLPVFINTKSNRNYVLEIDLVKEHNYWFSDAGMTMPNRVRIKRQLYISTQNVIQSDSAGILMDKFRNQQISEYQKREERSEIIIFSLLNSLKKMTEQDK